MAKVEPMDCVLEYSRKGLVPRGREWESDQKRRASLPEVPPGYTRLRGPYGIIARHAISLNDAQAKAGFIAYLYHPEPATETKEDKQ